MSQKSPNANILKERKPTAIEVDFMKLIEEQNVQRVLKLKKQRKNNILTGKLQKFVNFSSFIIRHDFFLTSSLCLRLFSSQHLRILHVCCEAGEIFGRF